MLSILSPIGCETIPTLIHLMMVLILSLKPSNDIEETPVRTTTGLYSQRYQNIRPHPLPPVQVSTDSEIAAHIPCFVITPSFAKVLRRFEEMHFKSFPEYPCAFCGVLSPLRKTIWIDFDQSVFDDAGYGLASHLGFQLCRNADGKIATCSICKSRKRDAPDIGPWPQERLDVLQHSLMFLSFIKLNCNLGRTQSHSATQAHNRYSTYRTLSGMLTKDLAVDSYLTSFREYVSDSKPSSPTCLRQHNWYVSSLPRRQSFWSHGSLLGEDFYCFQLAEDE